MAIKRHQPCGKNRYASSREAIRVALHSSRRAGQPLRVYYCATCRGWHLTRKPERAGWDKAPAGIESVKQHDNGHYSGCPCGQCAWL